MSARPARRSALPGPWAVVTVFLVSLVPVAAVHATPAPTSRVERVQVVAALFPSQPATVAARRLAGLEAGTALRPGTGSSRSEMGEGSGSDADVAEPTSGPGPTAAGAEEHDAVFAPPGDYFDPFAPPVAAAPLGALLPTDRSYLLAEGSAGGAVCPLPGSRFWNDWGQPRSGGRFHTGTDMVAPAGTPIYALWDATVLRVDLVDTYVPGVEADLGGLTVSYATKDGTRSYNGHLASVPDYIRPGVAIRAGSVIGFVGQTGNARHSVPHLHIQVHPGGGGPVNPYPLLAEICD